jgi:MYXO-CTERM domain-containing protein
VFGLRAVGNPKLGYFVYPLAPGASRSGAVIVSNVGTAAGTVRLFAADATTGTTSGTVYKTDTAPTGAGSWVALSKSSFRLAPGGHRRVPFTVHVPEGQKPGQWVGGIVAETAQHVATQKRGQKARVQIKIRDLTIVAVQVNVPGAPVVQFSIGDVTTGGTRGFQRLIVHLANEGNLLVKPRGVVTITGSGGRVIESLPFTLDTFLPETAIDYPLLLKKALGPGDYVAKVLLTVPATGGVATKRFTAQPSFSVSNSDVKQVFTSAAPQQPPSVASSSSGVPTWAYLAAGAGLALLVLLALLLVRRRRGGAEDGAPPDGPPVVEAIEAATAAPEPAPEPETAEPSPADHEHDWDVAYDRGELGADGAWRFPHRCRRCGTSILARDVHDASAQSASGRLTPSDP